MVRDFEPVILLPANSHVIAARKSLPANTLMELVEWPKANQDKVAMATAGVGTGGHFGAGPLQHLTHTEFPLVHYRGGGPALADLLAGHVDLTTNQAAVFLPHTARGHHQGFRRAGAAAAAAGAGNSDRRRGRPAGLPRLQLERLLGAEGTPKDVIDRLNAAVAKIMADPDMTQSCSN